MNEIKPCIFIKTRIDPDLIEFLVTNNFLKLSPQIQDVIIVNIKRGTWSTYTDE